MLWVKVFSGKCPSWQVPVSFFHTYTLQNCWWVLLWLFIARMLQSRDGPTGAGELGAVGDSWVARQGLHGHGCCPTIPKQGRSSDGNQGQTAGQGSAGTSDSSGWSSRKDIKTGSRSGWGWCKTRHHNAYLQQGAGPELVCSTHCAGWDQEEPSHSPFTAALSKVTQLGHIRADPQHRLLKPLAGGGGML